MTLFGWTWCPPLKFFGIPLSIDVSFVVLAGLLGYDRLARPELLAAWVLALFVSLLWHELGHAVAVRAYGLRPRIWLLSLGGLTTWSAKVRLTPAQQLVITLAGPGAGLLAAGLVYVSQPLFFGGSEVGPVLYADLLWVNVVGSLFNLLPILPLDGGRIIEIVGKWRFGGSGEVAAEMISLLSAVSLAVIAFNVNWWWLAGLGLWLAWPSAVVLVQMARDLWPPRREVATQPISMMARERDR